MRSDESINILLVDDQPAKLLSYEVILAELGENLIKASSANEALEHLLRNDVAVLLVDVCMPDLDGFQLAQMVRQHPRFHKTAIIFISAVLHNDVDTLRGYEMGAVDYVPVPVIPAVLRAKVRVFAELYRKSRQLERLNAELEERVVERTAALEATNAKLVQSEQLRGLALAAAQMGSWDWDVERGEGSWDDGQCRIFGVDPHTFTPKLENVRALLHADDLPALRDAIHLLGRDGEARQVAFRAVRPDGEVRRCVCVAAVRFGPSGKLERVSGVTIDVTERKKAEEHQSLLSREVDHRAKNALAIVQAIVRLTRAPDIKSYVGAIEGRIGALSRVHSLLSKARWEGADIASIAAEEMQPYNDQERQRFATEGPAILVPPAIGQTLGLAFHELATNAAKYGALSSMSGRTRLTWALHPDLLVIEWIESGGPPVEKPSIMGFGVKTILAAVERQLHGRVEFDWRKEGLHCTFSIPRDERMLGTRPPLPAHANGADVSPLGPRLIRGNRILLVEDEPLIAMMMKEALSELDYDVRGPISSVDDALSEIANGTVDGAVLDINLGGTSAYPVADALVARDIPFVFITGYARQGVEARFSQTPVLSKPVDRELLQASFARPASELARRGAAESS
jgi:two-component sensor histidine kinase/DNA-binding response OmpR family regulator